VEAQSAELAFGGKVLRSRSSLLSRLLLFRDLTFWEAKKTRQFFFLDFELHAPFGDWQYFPP
jgi:hypothetical protein